ncbi:MAG: hypothetical protein ACXVXY_09370 [Mycobacteriaceae bacterium]
MTTDHATHRIELATRIQRRRDFVAHLTGYAAGLVVLATTVARGASGPVTAAVTALAWATALSFQHSRHVLKGPVTPGDIETEDRRLATTRTAPVTSTPHPHEGA